MSTYRTAVESDGYHIPQLLKDMDVWVVWAPSLGKTARAPWQEGHMYPCDWAEDKPVDPREAYDKASAVASLPIGEVAHRWPFPNDADPDTVKPTILIPPESADNDLLFVDFDDVIGDGDRVPAEVWELVELLGGYTEISKSGDGLHVWVRGELPDGYGKFIEDLDTVGQIEMYDRGRMTGCTWRHIVGTPKEAVPQAQEAINTIVERYETAECWHCGAIVRTAELDGESPECPDCGDTFNGPDRSTTNSRNETTPSSYDGDDENPYYELAVTDVADTGPFRRHRDGWQGPHPKHGGTSSKDKDSTNFNVDTDSETWHCFAHGTGGGALSLIAVLEGIVSCKHANKIHKDNHKLLKACLAARNDYAPDLVGEDPPYNALVAVAEAADLPMKDKEAGILGRAYHSFAFDLYGEIKSYSELIAK